MESVTLMIGRILSAYLFISGLGFLISKQFYEGQLKNSDKSDPLTVNLSGMVHFIIGMLIVLNHFLWTNILEIVVTIFGFLFILKGIALIVIPKLTMKTTNSSVKYLTFSGIWFIVIALGLGYLSVIHFV